MLTEALGEFAEEKKHLGLSWAGKQEARRLAVTPGQGIPIPALGEGIDEEYRYATCQYCQTLANSGLG